MKTQETISRWLGYSLLIILISILGYQLWTKWNTSKNPEIIKEGFNEEIPDYFEQLMKSQVENANVELISGKWDDLNITDEQIKEYYQSAFLTIIPLIESLQPSGQSVALQSLMVGTPVMITRTSGFWYPKNFNNDENIIFVENNQINEWVEKINKLFEDQASYKNLIKKGKIVVSKNYNLESFNKQLLDILST